MSVSTPGPGGQGWQHTKAEAWASPPGHGDLAVKTKPTQGNNKSSVSSPTWPPPLPFPLSSLSEPLAPFGLTLGSYCSLVALWWGRGSNWPGFDSWLSLLSCVPQDWALNPLSLCFFSMMPALAAVQGGPKTWTRQHMLSVPRAVEHCLHAVVVTIVVVTVCVTHAPAPLSASRRRKELISKLWFAQCPAQSRCSVMPYWFTI